MELHQLRYFVAVARFRSFTRAAEREHVSQPSLSQQIRKLEDELGVRLFDRLGRRIKLTAFGERFQQHASRVLEEISGARQEVEEFLKLKRGTVAVGAVPTVAPYLLPKTLAAFSRACPGIGVVVREDLTPSLLLQLADGELDLALLSLPVKRAEFVSETLIEEAMLLALPRRHPLAARRRVAFRDVSREPFLLLKDGHCFRDDVLEICKRSRLKPQVVFEGGQFDTLVAMVAAGTGITLLPEMARAHYRHRGVELREFVPPRPTRTIGIVRPKYKTLSPASRAFIEVLKKIRISR
jgi:LysR family hydrogen peroxide-inducible transcriptional activator